MDTLLCFIINIAVLLTVVLELFLLGVLLRCASPGARFGIRLKSKWLQAMRFECVGIPRILQGVWVLLYGLSRAECPHAGCRIFRVLDQARGNAGSSVVGWIIQGTSSTKGQRYGQSIILIFLLLTLKTSRSLSDAAVRVFQWRGGRCLRCRFGPRRRLGLGPRGRFSLEPRGRFRLGPRWFFGLISRERVGLRPRWRLALRLR